MAVRRPHTGAPGQHFLRSSRLAAALVEEAGVSPSDRVVEIGAGTGVLTRALSAAGAFVTALEMDRRLAADLRARALRNVEVIAVNALDWNWPAEPFAVVANLPFAQSGAILTHLLGDPRTGLRGADVIVQWELAAKQAAVWPATARSTHWRAWFDISISRRLERSAFSPVPRVDAAVLRVTRRSHPLVRIDDHPAYWRFLADAFHTGTAPGRFGSGLSRIEVKRLAPTLGFAPYARPRDLDYRQWAALFAATTPRRG